MIAAKSSVVAATVVAATINRRRINLNAAVCWTTRIVVTAAISAVIGLAITSTLCAAEIVAAVAIADGKAKWGQKQKGGGSLSLVIIDGTTKIGWHLILLSSMGSELNCYFSVRPFHLDCSIKVSCPIFFL